MTQFALLSVSLLGTAALTACQSYGDMAPPTGHQDASAGEFAQLNANGDGRLSRTELAQHRLSAHFDMLDTDRDGQLSQTEFAAGHDM